MLGDLLNINDIVENEFEIYKTEKNYKKKMQKDDDTFLRPIF